ncbi:rho guanine nucleotide exchange factor 10-like isoform X3 [Planococcus citri]
MTSSSSEPPHHYAAGPSTTAGRKPFLRFPPPPPYPPGPGPSSEYAYAYYEPGLPGPGPGPHSKKHSYITRYGTEENIYEEISPTRLEEEVRYVHSRHLQVLDELNLTVEAMLMPQPSAVAALNQEGTAADDLSPASCSLDSGFSGSSSGTNSLGRSYTPKQKKPPQRFWKKLSTLGSTSNCSKIVPPSDEPVRCNSSLWEENAVDPSSSQQSSAGSEHDTSSGDESNKCPSEVSCNINKGHATWRRNTPSPEPPPPSGRLSRWFSIRRGSQFDLDQKPNKMPLLPEVEEESCGRRPIPTLPSPPPHLGPQELKRRHIVAAIIESENSYLDSLRRLVNDYKKPLEESSPPILSQSKISRIFYKVPEILQCHTLFRIALAEAVNNWDSEHRIGDVFVASFSKAIVLDIYSEFINNFSVAMDLARCESKKKAALAEFFKSRQVSSPDRLSIFGLMVKPVQRFPQFILFLQDLLHHTGHGHEDRMSLQLALTQLESLAELLNERKREAEQAQAFKEMLRAISGKLPARPVADNNRCLIRQDDVTQLEINQNGLISKHKSRRLLLLNDLLVCVSVSRKDDSSSSSANSQRLTMKWNCPITDIQVIETTTSPTFNRLLTPNGSLSSNSSNGDSLCLEMSNLMHDYEVISRISDLATTLRGNYPELNMENTRTLLNSIQCEIQRKGDQMAWVDACCLQISVNRQLHTFQLDSPQIRNDWITELRLARLALDPNNSPAWEVPELDHRPSTKMPLFVGDHCIASTPPKTDVVCGCFYTSSCGKTSYLWICTMDNYCGSHIAVMSVTGATYLKQVTTLDLPEIRVTALEVVRATDTVWMGTSSQKLLIYSVLDISEVASITLPSDGSVVQIKQHCDSVFVALSNGTLLLYRRANQAHEPDTIVLGPPDPVSCILPINLSLYVACGKNVYRINAIKGEIQKTYTIQHDHVGGNVNLMAHSGVGLWLSLTNSTTICLYHTETFTHLQDINVASNVLRLTGSPGPVCVTALMACKGLLWVGTDAGISLTVPLPRLEGVPIISGRVNVSYHAHMGPVRLLLPLQDPPTVLKRPPSKTLACDIYGLYGQLMYVKNYDEADDKTISHWSLSTCSEETTTNSPSASNNISRALAAEVAKREREQTLVTITCGRGYVNYQQPCCTNNENNAHIIIWELKL